MQQKHYYQQPIMKIRNTVSEHLLAAVSGSTSEETYSGEAGARDFKPEIIEESTVTNYRPNSIWEE